MAGSTACNSADLMLFDFQVVTAKQHTFRRSDIFSYPQHLPIQLQIDFAVNRHKIVAKDIFVEKIFPIESDHGNFHSSPEFVFGMARNAQMPVVGTRVSYSI